MIVSEKLCTLLREERTKQGLSLRQLGLLSDLNHLIIFRIESGLRDPQFVLLKKILDALKIELTIKDNDFTYRNMI